MKKMFHLVSLLLLASAWLVAQTSSYPSDQKSDQNQQPSQNQGANETSNEQTIRGCLAGSNGSYTLTDDSGNSYQLAGNTTKLEKHVGHEVELRGKAAPSSQTGANQGEAGAPGGAQAQTFEVMSVRHLASSCSNSQNQNQNQNH